MALLVAANIEVSYVNERRFSFSSESKDTSRPLIENNSERYNQDSISLKTRDQNIIIDAFDF